MGLSPDPDYDPCGSTLLDCSNTAGCTLDAENGTTCFCLEGYELKNGNVCEGTCYECTC